MEPEGDLTVALFALGVLTVGQVERAADRAELLAERDQPLEQSKPFVFVPGPTVGPLGVPPPKEYGVPM